MMGIERCPFHLLAKKGDCDGPSLFDIGVYIEALNDGFDKLTERCADLNKAGETLPGGNTSAASLYIGEITQHASFHNQGREFPRGRMPIASDKHTPLGRTLGEVHAQYRKIAAHIGELLDIKSLSPETQASIKRYAAVKKEYGEAVLRTGHAQDNILPDHHCLADARKKEFTDRMREAVHGLVHSELAGREIIPILAAGHTAWVKNRSVGEQSLGLYLFCLKQASIAQVDQNKLPNAGDYHSFERQIGTQSYIPLPWEHFSEEPLKTEIRRITEHGRDSPRHLLGKEAEALQTANLMMGLMNDGVGGNASEQLCRFAGISSGLARLSSPLQAAAIAECLALNMNPHDQTAPKCRLFEAAKKWRRAEPLTLAESRDVEAAVGRMEIGPAMKKQKAVMQACALVKDFAQRERSPAHARVATHEACARAY